MDYLLERLIISKVVDLYYPALMAVTGHRHVGSPSLTCMLPCFFV
jgi:hypothetical protein